jgi:hypothetical protein
MCLTPVSLFGDRDGTHPRVQPEDAHNTNQNLDHILSHHRVDWTTWWPWRGAYTRSHPELGREIPQRPWYCVSRHGRVGRRQVFQSTPLTPGNRGHTTTNAGWSSPVARQAHNLKVIGSNPIPATNDACASKASDSPESREGTPGFLLRAAKLSIPAKSPRNVMAKPHFRG